MKPINESTVKIKNLIGIIDQPTYEDLLFEIASFLSKESSAEGEFRLKDASFKTRVRLSADLNEDILKLVEMGYVEKTKSSSYKVIKHPWE